MMKDTRLLVALVLMAVDDNKDGRKEEGSILEVAGNDWWCICLAW